MLCSCLGRSEKMSGKSFRVLVKNECIEQMDVMLTNWVMERTWLDFVQQIHAHTTGTTQFKLMMNYILGCLNTIPKWCHNENVIGL